MHGRTRTRAVAESRWLRRPAFDILEDRLPVAEPIGTVATLALLSAASHIAPPPPNCAA